MKLNQLTITEAQAGLKAKKFSVVELVSACLEQIKKYDPKLHCFLTLNDQALVKAKIMDKKPDWSKSLFGIPFALKDNFLTQGIRTTASAKLLDDYLPQYNATVYKRLLDAGAILLGKTNLDAWAHGSSTETSDYGPTLNPWNPAYLPGGSSGGSAAAVAADMCIFAIGSETAGSVRQPAAWCGITGFKPTYGRVSRYGVIAMASSTDSPGPHTKNVQDAAIVTQVISGLDPYDATSNPKPIDIRPNNLQGLSLKGKKIALPKEYLLCEAKDLVLQAASVFKSAGFIVEEVSLLDPNYAVDVYTLVQRSEVSSNLARFDGVRYGADRSAFSYQAKNRSLLGAFALSAGYYDQYYKKAQQVRTKIIHEFDCLFQKYAFYLAPTSPSHALKVGEAEKNPMFGEIEDRLVEAAAVSGLTGLSLPCGFIDNLPIGLQLTGPQFSEQTVLSAGNFYQTKTNFHLQKPKL